MGLHVVREGHGEEDALLNLIYRVQERRAFILPHVPRLGNWRKSLIWRHQVENTCRQVVGSGTCEALLLTRDADNDDLADADCPRTTAPEIASWVRELALPFPVAVVLFYKEYETLFLAGAEAMAGREVKDRHGVVVDVIHEDCVAHPDPEFVRGAKGWVARHIIDGYKPTLFQTSLTRLLDLDVMDGRGLSSYRRLVSALDFLSSNLGSPGAVYPPSVEAVVSA